MRARLNRIAFAVVRARDGIEAGPRHRRRDRRRGI